MKSYNTHWVADLAVMTITIDECQSEEEAEERSFEILEAYLGESHDLFHLDEVEEYN